MPFRTWHAVHAHSQKWSRGNAAGRGLPQGQMNKCSQGVTTGAKGKPEWETDFLLSETY